LAIAARTASVLVRGFFSGVGVVGSRSTGCILMGPVLSDCGVLLGMTVNAQPPFSFESDG
jgi:hypothetical protein